MLITNCLAYEDIKVKLSTVNDSFNLSIDANKVEISLTLNYLQLKTLMTRYLSNGWLPTHLLKLFRIMPMRQPI